MFVARSTVRPWMRAASSSRGFSSAAGFVDFDRSKLPQQASWSLKDTRVSSSAAPAVPPVTTADLKHLSHLSYLPHPADDSVLIKDIVSVIAWFESITHLDMKAHSPMYTPLEVDAYYQQAQLQRQEQRVADSEAPLPPNPEGVRLRDDVVTDGSIEKHVLTNATFKHRGFFAVPKVVDLED